MDRSKFDGGVECVDVFEKLVKGFFATSPKDEAIIYKSFEESQGVDTFTIEGCNFPDFLVQLVSHEDIGVIWCCDAHYQLQHMGK